MGIPREEGERQEIFASHCLKIGVVKELKRIKGFRKTQGRSKMRTMSAFLIAVLAFSAAPMAASAAGEKIKFATAVKLFPVFYLPVLAAEERGYWKEEDLEVEWVPFAGGHPMNQAIAAGAIDR